MRDVGFSACVLVLRKLYIVKMTHPVETHALAAIFCTLFFRLLFFVVRSNSAESACFDTHGSVSTPLHGRRHCVEHNSRFVNRSSEANAVGAVQGWSVRRWANWRLGWFEVCSVCLSARKFLCWMVWLNEVWLLASYIKYRSWLGCFCIFQCFVPLEHWNHIGAGKNKLHVFSTPSLSAPTATYITSLLRCHPIAHLPTDAWILCLALVVHYFLFLYCMPTLQLAKVIQKTHAVSIRRHLTPHVERSCVKNLAHKPLHAWAQCTWYVLIIRLSVSLGVC